MGKAVKTDSEKFDKFWEVFPPKRKGGKKVAISKFLKLPEEIQDYIIKDVEEKKVHHRQWLVEDGQYIPAPEVYLNKEQWLIQVDYAEKQDRKLMDWVTYFEKEKGSIGKVQESWLYRGREYADKLQIVEAIRNSYQEYIK